MVLNFAYYQVFYLLVPVLLLALIYRIKIYKQPVYKFPPISFLTKTGFVRTFPYKKVLMGLRFALLASLILLIARPRWVDPSSAIRVNGVDIVLALDLSGSMSLFDDLNDRRPRIQVLKEEAIRFIDKRTNDPIGVVIFAGDVISRCPLTLDKNVLKEIVSELNIGYINPNATLIGTGIATSINRLRDSKASSKVIILLTDGVPSMDQITPDIAIELAKKFGIKIYTVGIGGDSGGYFVDPLGGIANSQNTFDMHLLNRIASETGAKSFQASSAKDMRNVYNTIDSLEKTEIDSNVFHNYQEGFDYFIWVVIILLCVELFLRLFLWRGIL